MSELREFLRELLPEAEECISYSMPGFRLRGKMVAGYAGFKNHVGFFPHSGQVFKEMTDELAEYSVSAKGGGMHLPLGRPIPQGLIAKAVDIRIHQAFDE